MQKSFASFLQKRRPSLTRRSLLAAGLTAALPRPTDAAELPSLKQAAAKAGLLVGCDSDVTIKSAPPAYAQLIPAQCDLLAPQVSWRHMAPLPTSQEPAAEDPNIAFALSHGMRLTGGHFVWHENMPAWFEALSPAAAQAAIERHIRQVGSHYRGQVYSWNVVNEAIDTRYGDRSGLRRTAFLNKLGPDFIATAFRAAREADPHALLVYNDFAMEMDVPLEAARRDALRRLLDRVQRDGPIDAVGLQTHLRFDDDVFNADLYNRFLAELAARGLKILITEMDVLDYNGSGAIEDRDRRVADLYRTVLSVAVAQPAVRSITVWGLSDRYTWLTAARSPHFGRVDGLPTRPLPFDDMFQPKPAFYAILDVLRNAPRR